MKRRSTLLFIAFLVLASYAGNAASIVGTWYYNKIVTITTHTGSPFSIINTETDFNQNDNTEFNPNGSAVTRSTNLAELSPGSFTYQYNPATHILSETPSIRNVVIKVISLSSTSLSWETVSTVFFMGHTTQIVTTDYLSKTPNASRPVISASIIGTWHYKSCTGSISINGVPHNTVAESNYAPGDIVTFMSNDTASAAKTDTTQTINPGTFNYKYTPATKSLVEGPIPADFTLFSITVTTLTPTSLVYNEVASQTIDSNTTMYFNLTFSFSR